MPFLLSCIFLAGRQSGQSKSLKTKRDASCSVKLRSIRKKYHLYILSLLLWRLCSQRLLLSSSLPNAVKNASIACRSDPAALRQQLKEIIDQEQELEGGLNPTLKMKKKALQQAYNQAIQKQMVRVLAVILH
jgi:hypothetical protein